MSPDEPLLTGRELSAVVKVKRATLWRWRRLGCPHIKVGPKSIRYRLSEVLEWLRK